MNVEQSVTQKLSCKTCPGLDINFNSDEAYCRMADGEEIQLVRGQRRPRWCPKAEQGGHDDT